MRERETGMGVARPHMPCEVAAESAISPAMWQISCVAARRDDHEALKAFLRIENGERGEWGVISALPFKWVDNYVFIKSC